MSPTFFFSPIGAAWIYAKDLHADSLRTVSETTLSFKTACDAFDALPQEPVIAGCLAIFAVLAVTDRVLARRWSQ